MSKAKGDLENLGKELAQTIKKGPAPDKRTALEREKFFDSLRGLARQSKYRGVLKRFLDFLENAGMGFDSPSSIQEAVSQYRDFRLKKQRVKPATFNVDVVGIRRLIREMLARSENVPVKNARVIKSLLTEYPFKLSSPQTSISEDMIVSPEEIELLIENSTEKLGLFIEFLYRSGCRVSEMLGIGLEDIRKYNGHFLIRVLGKGSKVRDLPPVPKDLIERIKKHFEPVTFLFETRGKKRQPYRREYVSHEIAKVGERVLGRKISAHSLRHSSGTRIYQVTGSVKKTQHFLGHSRASITADMYIHETYSQEELDMFNREIKGKILSDEKQKDTV